MLYYGLEWQSCDTYMQFKEVSPDPDTPPLNEIRQYASDNGSGASTMCWKNDAGSEVCLPFPPAAGGLVDTDGTGSVGEVAFFVDANTIGGDSDFTFTLGDTLTVPKISAGNLQWNGTLLSIAGANDTELFRISAVNQILSVKENTAQSAVYFTVGTDDQTNAYFNAPESFRINIDAANDSTTRDFSVFKNSSINTGTQLFTVKEAEQVGIGDVDPASLFATFPGMIQRGDIVIGWFLDSAGFAPAFAGINRRGTQASPTPVQTGDGLAKFVGSGQHTTGGATNTGIGGNFQVTAAETWTSTARGAWLDFFTNSLGAISPTQRARIDDRGNLLIGTTAQPTTGSSGLVFADGTALATMASNTAGQYANDVGGTVTMFSIDEAGVASQHGPWGTYTPTLTNVANLDASTSFQAQYVRFGNVVTVSGKVEVDPTLAATSTQLGISLPIASNIGAQEDCAGSAFASGIAGQGAAIRGDAANDRAEMVWVSGDITNQPMYFIFSYEVI